jgi:RHS repeat-associated protein
MYSPAPSPTPNQIETMSKRTLQFLALLLAVSVGAADKNGVSPNAISVPSGPGSIEGLGDSFQPALNNGTMAYGLALRLPPGTAGHTPKVQFGYEGGQANGPFGFGWSLSLPFIQRQTDKGIPRYADAPNSKDDDRDGEIDEADEIDRFISDEKEELVPLANGDYFCENEQSFVRYRRVAGHWEGIHPNGTKMEFGLTADAQVSDGATNRVFKWLIERETDTHGNTIVYSWQSFPGGTNTNQKYLKEIRYGRGAPPWASFHFVSFTYEDRPDWFEDCRSGFIVRTGKRLQEVVIGTQGVTPAGHATGDFNGDGSSDVLNRKYRFAYLDYAPGRSHWSLLSAVTQVGADGISTLPPARFDYAISDPPATVSASSQFVGGTNEPLFVMDNSNVDLADLNGDGLPDLLRTGAAGGAHVAYLNRGEQGDATNHAIAWAAAQQIQTADGFAWNVTLQSATDVAHLSDMNGDGLADLVYKSAIGDVFFFANQGTLAWGSRRLMNPQDIQPPSPFGSANVRTADIDFDKRMDVIESISSGSGADYRIWFNLGNQRYARSLTVPQISGFMFSLAGVQIADFNGDRVPDIVRIQPTAIVVTAGLGHGNFAPPVTVPLSDWTFDSTQIAKARLEDITGDGLVDVVLERAAPGQIWYWLNKGNYTLDSRRLITGLPGALSATTRWADLNGNGTTDLIFADSTASPKLLTVDLGRLLGCVPAPNTLIRIENGIGSVTTIEYASSTRFAVEDAALGKAWTNQLPFPVTVIARVLTSDSLGHTYETRFRYHQGYYDAPEKQFRGFTSAEQIDVGDPTAPTSVSRSYFDTGRQFESMKGKRLRVTTEQENGEIFWDEVVTWTASPRILYTGTNGQTVNYVFPTAKRKVVRELGRGESRTVESEFAYDNYGNQTLDANYGIVADADRSAFDDERITTNHFALNLSSWIVRTPSRTEIRDEHGAVISRVENFYDDETFSGNNWGEVQIGNPTMRREWHTPSALSGFVASARTKYDAYGNPVTQLDPLAVISGNIPDPGKGHFRTVSYDSQFHTHATEESVHPGGGHAPLVTQADYDPAFGTLIASRDYNAHQTTCSYDAFGRLQSVVRPGDTAAYPTTEYEYVLAQPAGPNQIVNYVETRSLDKAPGSAGARRDHYLISREFTDGLDRKVMIKKEAEPAPDSGQPRAVIEGATLFNARLKPAAVLNACFSTATGDLDELLKFEDISQPGWQGSFHQMGQLVSLDLAAAHKTATKYDATLREIQRTNPDGTFLRTIFEAFKETRFDESDNTAGSPHEGTPNIIYQDGLGRQIRTDELVRLNDDGTSSGALKTWTTAYAFDLNDQLIRITDSQGNIKHMFFDGQKRLIAMNDPDRGVSTNYYDAASNRIETRDAKGQRITYTYDGANRLLSEDYHDEGQLFSAGYVFDPAQPVTAANRPDIAYFYDTPANAIDAGNGSTATAQNTKGMLAFVWDLSGEEHLSYDLRRRDAWTVKRIRDPRHGKLVSYQTRQTYDALNRLVQTVYPDNDAVTYGYNERNLPGHITGELAGPIITSIDYLPGGKPRQIKFGNGVLSTCSYDARSRVISLVTAREADAAQPYVAFDYGFDGVSNIETIRDQRPATSAPDGSPRRNSQGFDYDDLYRLVRSRYGLGIGGDLPLNNGQINYRYDRIGNLLSQTSDITHLENGKSLTHLGTLAYGGAAGASGRNGRTTSEPGPHALSQMAASTNVTSWPYDANGNVTQKDAALLTWDFKDRLVSVADATMRTDYTYDYKNRRIVRRVAPILGAAKEITFYVSPSFEVRPSETPTKFVWNGPTRVARITGSLSGNSRIQRLRLASGWNLVSLAVSIADLLAQLPSTPSPEAQSPVVETAYRWNAATQSFIAVTPGDAAPAGALLWLKASVAGTLSLTGSFAEPAILPTVTEPGFVSWPGFEPLPLGESLAPDIAAWFFPADAQRWLVQLPESLVSSPQLLPCLAPGQALFIRPITPVTLAVPDSSLRIRYYHQDHLGSSSVMTDAAGNLIEETAYYPFGAARHSWQPRHVRETYQFTQKERDEESGLQYFEARYLSGSAGRFLSVDPAYAEPLQLGGEKVLALLANPQAFNLYTYVLNNPLRYTDPSGCDPKESSGETLPRSVLPTYKRVLPWVPWAFAGHGMYAKPEDVYVEGGRVWVRPGAKHRPPGTMVVPEGTTITFYADFGETISDDLGGAIEQQKLPKEQKRYTFHPGDVIPNYTLAQPLGLNVTPRRGVSDITVDKPTSLSQLLKPGMGAVHWAACCQDPAIKPTSVGLYRPPKSK